MLKDLLYIVLLTAISFITAMVRVYVVPYFKEKIEGTKLEEVFTLVGNFVVAAEKNVTSGGVDKKEYVTKLLKELLVAKNISLTDDQVSAIIDAFAEEYYPHKDKVE